MCAAPKEVYFNSGKEEIIPRNSLHSFKKYKWLLGGGFNLQDSTKSSHYLYEYNVAESVRMFSVRLKMLFKTPRELRVDGLA